MKTSPKRLTNDFAFGPLSKTLTEELFSAISALAFGALLTSCATSLVPSGAQVKTPRQEALVCPECKIVAVTKPYRWGRSSLHQVYEDACPGCQGIIVTLFREGKLQHNCSICKEKPFKCPVFHL